VGGFEDHPIPIPPPWPDDIDVVALLNDDTMEDVPPGAHERLLTEVESWDEVASVSYLGQNDAWLEYQQVFEGQDDLLDIDPALLPASIRIELTDIAFQDVVRSRLEQETVVWKVQTAPTDEEPSAASSDCVDQGATTTTVVETTIPGPTCAAAESGPPTTVANGDPSYDLTEPVAQKLTEIAEAAAGCNATGLAALASDDITTTFGPDGGREDIASWPGDDERFKIINGLFNLTHGVTEMPDGSRLYVWPAAFAYDTWDEIPAPAKDELLRIYSQEELDHIAQLGSYGGWRIGITEAGEWIFFVAGD
jgi:hypothetical protein